MPNFRKKPVVITAERVREEMRIHTPESPEDNDFIGRPGDWLITGVKGEKYFCEHEVFVRTYDAVDAEGQIALEETDPAWEGNLDRIVDKT
jgi:hypothetical protein